MAIGIAVNSHAMDLDISFEFLIEFGESPFLICL